MNREPHDETEYQFNDAEDATFEPASEAKEANATQPDDSGRKKRSSTSKALITLVILVVAAFVVYKIFTFFVSPKTKSTPAMAPITSTIKKATVATTPVSTIAQQLAPTTTTQAPTPVMSDVEQAQQTMSNLVKAVGDVQSSSNDINAKLTQNDSRMNSLEQQIADLNNSLSQLHDGLLNVQANLVQTQILEKQIKYYKQQLNVLTARKIRLRKQYFVQAVVPGRAWLRGADGTTTTIAVGDTLSGYGKIKSIDPYSGTVTTSTGVNIYYGLDEN